MSTAVARVQLRRARSLLSETPSALFAVQALSAGVAFVANILAARTLEPAGRGELALLLQIAYLGSLGLVLGTDRSVVAVCSGAPVRTVTRVFGRLLIAPSTAGIAVAVLVLALPLMPDWHVPLGLALLFAVTNAFVKAVRAIAICTSRAREFLAYGVVSQVLLFGGLATLAVTGVRSIALWVLAYLVAGSVSATLWFVRWARHGAEGTPPVDASTVRAARREGWALVPATVATSSTLNIDRLILPLLASTTALGIYATVATMTELIAWPLMAYADSRLGLWRKAHDGGRLTLRRVFASTTGYVLIAGGLCVLVMRLALVPLFGEPYRPALQLIEPLVLAAGIYGFAQILITALTSVRRAWLASTVEIVGTVISVIAYVVLISREGALGAAWGSVIGYGSVALLAAVTLLWARRPSRRSGADDQLREA